MIGLRGTQDGHNVARQVAAFLRSTRADTGNEAAATPPCTDTVIGFTQPADSAGDVLRTRSDFGSWAIA